MNKLGLNPKLYNRLIEFFTTTQYTDEAIALKLCEEGYFHTRVEVKVWRRKLQDEIKKARIDLIVKSEPKPLKPVDVKLASLRRNLFSEDRERERKLKRDQEWQEKLRAGRKLIEEDPEEKLKAVLREAKEMADRVKKVEEEENRLREEKLRNENMVKQERSREDGVKQDRGSRQEEKLRRVALKEEERRREEERIRREKLREEDKLRQDRLREENRLMLEKIREEKLAIDLLKKEEEKLRKEKLKEEEKLRKEKLREEEKLRREKLREKNRLKQDRLREENRLEKEKLREEKLIIKKERDERREENKVMQEREKIKLGGEMKPLLIGSMLSGGCINKDRIFSKNHGMDVIEYAKWKGNLLGLFGAVYKNRDLEIYHLYSASLEVLSSYRNLFYDNEGCKEIKEELIDMVDLYALAIWYLDAGVSMYYPSIYFYADKGLVGMENIPKIFEKFDLKVKWGLTKNGSGEFQIEDGEKFIGLIKPYVPECMLGKLNFEYKDGKTKKEIIQDQIENGFSIEMLQKEWGVGSETMKRWLLKFNLKLKAIIDSDRLNKLYLEDLLTDDQIAKLLKKEGIADATERKVRDLRKEYGIITLRQYKREILSRGKDLNLQ